MTLRLRLSRSRNVRRLFVASCRWPRLFYAADCCLCVVSIGAFPGNNAHYSSHFRFFYDADDENDSP